MPFPLFHPARRGDLPALLNADAFAREFPSEGDHVEFKNGVSNKVVQAAAAAFSNSEGGVCLFGVAPDGRVVGLHQPGEKTRQIHQALRDVSNPGRYQVHELVVDAATVLVLAVARRHEGFAQTSGGAVLARRGASNVPLLGEELSAFLARRTFQRFELTPTSVMVAEADPERCTRLGAAYSWPADNELSRRLDEAGFAVTDGGRHVLTVAGSLFLVPDPSVVGGRPFVDLRRYPHGEPDPDRTWQIDGPADALVRESTRTVLEELGTVSAIIGAERVDMPKIPPRVIREVMSNAVAHRSYEHAGSAIRVDLHPTHLVVTSPGGLPEPVTIDNLRHQQSARNDRVLGALRRFNLAEDRGLGIDRMQDDMAAELLDAPEFADDGAFFSVTLRLTGAVTSRERAWVRGLVREGRLEGRAGILVVEAARTGSLSNSVAREKLGIDSVEARALLRSLVAAGVLVQHGQRGGATYHIAPDLGVPARIRHTDDELDRIALALAAQGPVTNASLRAGTGLDRQEALKVLRRLADRGALVARGRGRGAHYERPA